MSSLIFAILKRIISIAVVLLLSFAGATELLHQFNESEEHCTEDVVHICPEEGHHHCSICDSILQTGLTPEAFDISTPVVYPIENNILDQQFEFTYIIGLKSSRAPPLV